MFHENGSRVWRWAVRPLGNTYAFDATLRGRSGERAALATAEVSTGQLFTAWPCGYSGIAAWRLPVKTGAISSFVPQATASLSGSLGLAMGAGIDGTSNLSLSGSGTNLTALAWVDGIAAALLSHDADLKALANLDGALTATLLGEGSPLTLLAYIQGDSTLLLSHDANLNALALLAGAAASQIYGDGASLALVVSLSAEALAQLSHTANLTGQANLYGTTPGTLSGDGGMSLAVGIEGAASTLLSGDGGLGLSAGLAGEAIATLSLAADPPLLLLLFLHGGDALVFSASAGLDIMSVLSGSVTASLSGAGDMRGESWFLGTADALISHSADLRAKAWLDGNTATESGVLTAEGIAAAVWSQILEGGSEAQEALQLIQRILANGRKLDPATGTFTIFADGGMDTPILEAPVTSDADGATPYNGTAAPHRQGPLEEV